MFFGVLGVRAPKTRRQQVHAKVQHVLVECPGLAQLLKALQLRAQVSGAVSLYSGSGAQHTSGFQAVLRRLGRVTVLSHLQGFEVSGGTDHFLRCRDVPALRRRGRWSSDKTLERYVQEGVCYLESLSLPTHAAELVAELSDLAPQVFHGTAAVLIARLPPQHRRPTFGKGGGGSCLSRRRAQYAGAETELFLGAVSEHLDLNC